MTSQDPADWVGRTESCADNLDIGHAERVALSLGKIPPAPGSALPPLWHWAFFVKSHAYAELGTDGHAHRGGFMPPAARRNRMWAGGRVEWRQPLVLGVPAARESRIAAVVEKQGRTGKLLFVTVKHEYLQNGVCCVSEEQDVVYREPSPPVLTGTKPAPEAEWSDAVTPNPVMLFRYSAVTFNGHRIHYDAPYVHDVEGYPGLVVHGPLIATRMVQAFVDAHPGKPVRALAYRGLRPLFSGQDFRVAGRLESPGHAALWAEQAGTLAHQGEIRFED